MQKKNTRAQECPFVLQERGDKRKIKQPRLQRGSGEASALPWLLFPAGLQQDFADGGRSLFQTQVPQTTAWLKTSTAASPPRCVSGSDSTERLCRDCFPEVRGLGRFRCCLSRQGQGLHTEQTLVGTSDPGMEQKRGVLCEVGDAFSWKHGVTWVGSHSFQLEKEPILPASPSNTLGVHSPHPCRT